MDKLQITLLSHMISYSHMEKYICYTFSAFGIYALIQRSKSSWVAKKTSYENGRFSIPEAGFLNAERKISVDCSTKISTITFPHFPWLDIISIDSVITRSHWKAPTKHMDSTHHLLASESFWDRSKPAANWLPVIFSISQTIPNLRRLDWVRYMFLSLVC